MTPYIFNTSSFTQLSFMQLLFGLLSANTNVIMDILKSSIKSIAIIEVFICKCKWKLIVCTDIISINFCLLFHYVGV